MNYFHPSNPFAYDLSFNLPAASSCGSPMVDDASQCTQGPSKTFTDYPLHCAERPQMMQTNCAPQFYEDSGLESPLSTSSTSCLTPIDTLSWPAWSGAQHEPAVTKLDESVNPDDYPYFDHPSSAKQPAINVYGSQSDPFYHPALPTIHSIFPSPAQLWPGVMSPQVTSHPESGFDPASFLLHPVGNAEPLPKLESEALPIHQPKPQRPPAPILFYSEGELASSTRDEAGRNNGPYEQQPPPLMVPLEDLSSTQFTDFSQAPHLFTFW